MSPDLQRQIALALAPLDEVRAAWLFGSRAPGGRPRADSDVDVAVVLVRGLGDRERHLAYGRALDALADALGPLGTRIDLLDLERAGASVAFKAIRDGVCVLDRGDGTRARTVATIARRYDDEAPHRAMFRRAAVAAARRL